MAGEYRVPAAAIRRAESLMSDTVRWTRAGSDITPIVIDPTTLLPTMSADVVVGEGPCRRYTKMLPRRGSGSMSAADYVVMDTTFAEIPLSMPPLKVNDVGTVTASVENPNDVGMSFKVAGLEQNTQGTKQRALIEIEIG